MAVKKGYKHTEVGVIPEEWDVVSTNNLIEPSSPIRYGVVQVGSHKEDGIPIVAIKFVKEIANANLHRTDRAIEQRFTGSRVRAGDVLISIKGTIGRVGVVPAGFEGNISRELARIRPNETVSSEYLAQQLEGHETQYRISNAVVGTTRLEFSIATLRQFQIPLPPTLTEQEAIAGALSDADAWIESLEQLIAKKRQIKQGAMQELLTGKRRLPGFSGKWEIQTVRDLFSLVRNGVVYTPDPFGQSRITRIETISDGAIDFERTGTFNYNRRFADFRMIAGDMLFSHINSVEHIGKIAIYDGVRELFHGMNLLLLRVATSSNADFLYQLLNFATTRQRLRLLAKQAVSQASINTTELKAFELAVPCSDEQAAIAGVLSDMDTEIKALESKLAKAREIKQGMMQELLTGRIRLIEN